MRFALVPRQNEFYDLFAQAGANTLAAAHASSAASATQRR